MSFLAGFGRKAELVLPAARLAVEVGADPECTTNHDHAMRSSQ
jgi:hypothetical protein